MKTHFQLGRTKLNRLVVGSKVNFLLFLVFVLGFIAPYAHIPYNTNDSEGIFGFSYMSSFFFAIGFPIFVVCLSVLLFFASSFMPDSLKKLFRVFSVLSAFTGFYFLVWSINPYVEDDFHPSFYYGAMALISAVLTHSTIFIQEYLSTSKRLIRYLMDRLVIDSRPHIKDQKKYVKEIVEPTIDKLYEET